MQIGDIVYVKLRVKAIIQEEDRTRIQFAPEQKVPFGEAFNTIVVDYKEDLFIPAERI